jgi:lipoprotein-anchoring transpeptidase ErfK/SrfK
VVHGELDRTPRSVGRLLVLVGLATLLSGVDSAEPVTAGPPYDAWISEGNTRIQIEPKRTSRIIGGLSRGDVVRVVECVPSCTYRTSYVRIEPIGFVRVGDLGHGPRPAEENDLHPDAAVRYVRAVGAGAITRREPSERAVPMARHRGRDEIVLVGDPARDVPGYYRRAGGGWIASSTVRPLTPSALRGTESPTLPLAFVLEEAAVTAVDGSTLTVHRYDRFPYLGEADETARISLGTLPRASIRVARAVPRPAGVPAGAKWVHVSLNEQTLVAYEGDTPYFTTLVSTGTYGHPTHTGLHTVRQKTRTMVMNGTEEGDRYRVEAVSNVMFFHSDLALHTAYWHDRFGRAVSHGCVNLAPADAQRMFGWALPEVPSGFRTVYPDRLGLPSLYVLVTR